MDHDLHTWGCDLSVYGGKFIRQGDPEVESASEPFVLTGAPRWAADCERSVRPVLCCPTTGQNLSPCLEANDSHDESHENHQSHGPGHQQPWMCVSEHKEENVASCSLHDTTASSNKSTFNFTAKTHSKCINKTSHRGKYLMGRGQGHAFCWFIYYICPFRTLLGFPASSSVSSNDRTGNLLLSRTSIHLCPGWPVGMSDVPLRW